MNWLYQKIKSIIEFLRSFLSWNNFEWDASLSEIIWRSQIHLNTKEPGSWTWWEHENPSPSQNNNINTLLQLFYKNDKNEKVLLEGKIHSSTHRNFTSAMTNRKWCVINNTTWNTGLIILQVAFVMLNCPGLCFWLNIMDLFFNLFVSAGTLTQTQDFGSDSWKSLRDFDFYRLKRLQLS